MAIHQILKQYWGYDSFRPLQEDIIQAVLQDRDTLALLPTGGGKSICFQVPAMAREGICIVVSPLIALMKDQVQNLKERGIEAACIVSGMSKRETDIMLDNCIYGKIKFLYLSPERLLSELVKERIRYMRVNLFAIDEAHCISQWGYDFRPPYLQLASLRELHPKVPFLALTATATEEVVEEIQEKLAFRSRNVLRKSFSRPNLSYVVVHEENKNKKLFSIIAKVAGSGIVYVRNRRETQEIARVLNAQGFSADYYHAGVEAGERIKRQKQWMSGKIRIIVATNAFGMGIDKPDVRFVVHIGPPDSLEAYYQEAGRAGRDEQRAYAILLYNAADRAALQRRFGLSFPSPEEIREVYHALGNYYQLAYGAGEGQVFDMDIGDFCSRYNFDPIRTISAFKFLENDEYLSFTESVFLPSRIKMMAGAEDIYRFQIEYAGFDAFIKLLLRSYGGVFDQYVNIREIEIARRYGCTQEEVVTLLRKLEGHKVLNYLRQTDKPQIFFTRPRATNQQLLINQKYILSRKKLMGEKISAVLRYAESDTCRSVSLLRYFGELSARKCGTCDVCLGEKKSMDRDDLDERIEYEILQILSAGSRSLDDLIAAVDPGEEGQRLAVLRMLLDAGKVSSTGNLFFIPEH